MDLYKQHLTHWKNHSKDKRYQQCSGYGNFGNKEFQKRCCNNCSTNCNKRSGLLSSYRKLVENEYDIDFGSEGTLCEGFIGVNKNVIYE